VKITADRKRKRPAKEVTWTTHPPPPTRAPAQDIMTKRRRISNEALAAETEKDFFSLFFTVSLCYAQCCGSGSGIRCLFDP